MKRIILSLRRAASCRLATTLVALAGLVGCASPPETSPPPPIVPPGAWSMPGGDGQAPQAWLADFNSPALESLVAEALGTRPDVRGAVARVEQALAEAAIAGADPLPTASLGLDGSRQKINTFGPQATGGVRFENYEMGLNLSWELDLWGRLRDRSSAALARVEAATAELRAVRLSLVGQVTKAWFNLLEASAQADAARATAETWVENRRTLESRFQKGLSNSLDLRRIRSQTTAAKADLEARKRALDRARRNLEILIGRYPKGETTELPALPPLGNRVPAGLPATLLERRPDLVAAERRLAAADREWQASRKERLPQISLTGSGGTSSREFRDLLDRNFSVWTLAGNLAQPIFQGGRIRAGIDRSRSLVEQAAAEYHDTALQAFLEVESALAAEALARREHRQLDLASQEAEAAETLAWERYRKGTANFLTVLEARRSAATARSRLLSVRNFLLQNRVDLYLALGGPFSTEP